MDRGIDSTFGGLENVFVYSQVRSEPPYLGSASQEAEGQQEKTKGTEDDERPNGVEASAC